MSDQPPKRYRWLSIGWKTLRAIGIPFLGVLLFMLYFENSLIHPAPKYPRGDWEPAHLQYEDVYFTSADGTKLNGWYVEHPEARAQVIYFHGNGQNVASLAPLLNRMSHEFKVSVFAVDWRGYGRSEGSASEAGVLADSEAGMEWLGERAGVELNEIVPHGRSLGGAAAVHVATKYQTKALVLDETFTCMPDVAAPLYPWAPVRLLMRTKYDSIGKIANFEGMLFQSHGDADRLIPPELGLRLHRAAATANKELIIFPGKGHNDPLPEKWFTKLGEFYNRLSGASF